MHFSHSNTLDIIVQYLEIIGISLMMTSFYNRDYVEFYLISSQHPFNTLPQRIRQMSFKTFLQLSP